MKYILILFFVLLLTTSHFSQQFSRLNGLEDSQGNTILLYSFGVGNLGRFSPVFKYEVNSGIETKIMDTYSNVIDTSYTNSKTIEDYEFFPNDVNNFINVGFIFDTVAVGYAARNDTMLFNAPIIYSVDISKQNPLKVFLFGGDGPIRSWDGGYSYPIDSIPLVANFIPIALSNFDDEIMFGINEDNKFSRNGIVVDTSLFVQSSYFKMLFDINQWNIYRINWTYGGYALNVSSNKGDTNTWTKTYQSENPIYITIDSTQSGAVFLADGKSIYKSVDNGYTFTHYKSLQSKLIGIYKKPNSETLYAASKYKLYEIKPDTTAIIKSVSIPAPFLEYYPLTIGNKWVNEYRLFTDLDNTHLATSYVRSKEVIGDSIAANGKLYYHLTEGNTHHLERVDTLEGKVFEYYEYPNLPGNEYVIADLIGEIGDTVVTFNPTLPDYPSYLIIDSMNTFNQFGITKSRKNFTQLTDSVSRVFSLTENIGLDFSHTTYIENLRYNEQELLGCVINGVVYGDTTITDVETDADLIPNEYKLGQNYPNPFNPITVIDYSIPQTTYVELKVINLLGQEVITLVSEEKSAGSYKVNIDASRLSSGVYFYQLRTGNYIATKKMILLK